MDVTDALLDSWDRHARIVNAVASRVDDTNKNAKPSPDGMPLYHHLAHMHGTRRYFLERIDESMAEKLADLFDGGWQNPTDDLTAIRQALDASALAVRQAVESALTAGIEKAGWYDNPVLYIQHMLWHEGWHVGLMFLGLRLAGNEPPEEWEEANVWGEWRTEEY